MITVIMLIVEYSRELHIIAIIRTLNRDFKIIINKPMSMNNSKKWQGIRLTMEFRV